MPRFSLQRALASRHLAWFVLGGIALIVFGVIGYLDFRVRSQFEGKRWALPAHIYARALELYPGARLGADQLEAELVALGYRKGATLDGPGSFTRAQRDFLVMSRAFTFWDGAQPAVAFHARFGDGELATLERAGDGAALDALRLEPPLVGSIHPAYHEDRILARLADVPPVLVQALLAIEDHDYYSHRGIDLRAVARAALTNLRAQDTVQGGSTLTQQLVKNFYLTSERTLRRKLAEVVMAVLLELHYNKQEILEAYLNEVYLGQDGNRAIHGFGLASQYYFGRPLGELKLPEVALLVGLVKGPSYYNPRRNPERALARRNLVLEELARQGFVEPPVATAAKSVPLGVTPKAVMATAYPAFLDYVRRQLRSDYRDQDLRSEGLRIFTSLDPAAQRAAERALQARLPVLEKSRNLAPGTLEAAVIVASVDHGEVLAVVGGREARFAGFNRALDAERQIGSLVKPVVYLTALERPHAFTLATLLDDSPLTWRERGMDKEWSPRNYDKEFHGQVALHTALAHSYNVATARLGLAVGVKEVVANLHRLGIEREIQPFASTFLGASNLTPMEVAQMYHTLASGGFRTPLRAVQAVQTADGRPLQRYALAVEQVFDAAPMYLLTSALQEAVREGTGQTLYSMLPPELRIAGKTGTTDEFRDSWFAAYTADYLGVVWVGRDDNQPTGLTGATGAMAVWGEMMAQLNPQPLQVAQPENVERVWVDRDTGMLTDASCPGAMELPFVRGSAPNDYTHCRPVTTSPSGPGGVRNWFRRWFR